MVRAGASGVCGLATTSSRCVAHQYALIGQPRAVFTGMCVGCLIVFTNLYLGLQSGWISIMTLQGSLLGYAVFRVIPTSVRIGRWRFRILERPLTTRENIVIQTVASSVGCLPLCAGAIGVLPALSILDPERDGASPIVFRTGAFFAWSAGLALCVGARSLS